MTPKEEVERLMNDGIPFAKTMLSTHAEFYPFGRALTPGREIQWVSATDGTGYPPSQVLLDLLIEAFRRGAHEGKYAAIALFFDVRILDPHTGHKTDAVQVALEHQLGYCADVFFPYSLAKGSVTFGQLFASPRQGLVFGTF